MEENSYKKLEDFVMMPRKLKDDYLNGILTKIQFDILVWVWFNTNPYNGSFKISYDGLVDDTHNEISNDSARKVISLLRKKEYIFFKDHKGRGGSFFIYPVGFMRVDKSIQTFEALKNKYSLTTKRHTQIQPIVKHNHNPNIQNHNFQDSIITNSITTAYTDNNKNNNKLNTDRIFLKKQNILLFQKNKPLPVEGFSGMCKNWEEERCWEIARELGETDMRFLISCLHKYGFNNIKKAYNIFLNIPSRKIENKAKYFNKLVINYCEKNKIKNRFLG